MFDGANFDIIITMCGGRLIDTNLLIFLILTISCLKDGYALTHADSFGVSDSMGNDGHIPTSDLSSRFHVKYGK